MSPNYHRLITNEQRYGLPARWLLLALGAILLLAPGLADQARPLRFVVAAYGLIALAATAIFTLQRPRLTRSAWLYWLAQLVDALYITALIALSGGLASPLHLLYPLLALKAILYASDLGGLTWLSFTFGPLYAAALWIAHGNLAFLLDPLFLSRYLLLLLLILTATLISWALAFRLREVDRLRAALNARTEDLAVQTNTLQRTATDLGDRVLELRSLQEVAKALSATLYLNETLRTIAERLHNLDSSQPCAVGLLDSDCMTLASLVVAGASSAPFHPPLSLDGDPALVTALRSGRSQTLATEKLARDGDMARLAGAWQSAALELTPLMARNQPIGALLVGLPDQAAIERRQSNLVESFAYFAATAVENARLYGDVADKSQELEAVLAGIGDGVLVVDTGGRLALMNPVARRILGAQDDPAPGLLSQLAPPDDLAALLDETAGAGQVLIRELSLPSAGLSSDGQPRTFQALAAPVNRATEAGEALAGVVTVLRDVTAQKELERMKSNFLSVVSHELKTPLHSIKGFVDIILMGKTGPVTELQRDFLGTVQEQTGHLQRLIEDLLEFSRLESGQIRLRPVQLAPADLAARVVDKLTPLASNKHLNLRHDLAPGFPEIEADPMRLEQVLTNLMENAIKFTDSGGEVQLRGWDRGDFVEMAVIDTGIGIPPEERERVFDRFYQVDSSARRRYKGTGLGLTICKHIVTQHGGRIWVEDGDNDQTGSAFHFTLPKTFPQSDQGEAALDFGVLAPAGPHSSASR